MVHKKTTPADTIVSIWGRYYGCGGGTPTTRPPGLFFQGVALENRFAVPEKACGGLSSFFSEAAALPP